MSKIRTSDFNDYSIAILSVSLIMELKNKQKPNIKKNLLLTWILSKESNQIKQSRIWICLHVKSVMKLKQ